MLTKIFSASIDIVSMRGLGVWRRGVQGGALVPADSRQPRHKRCIVFERCAHHPAVKFNRICHSHFTDISVLYKN